MENNYSVYQHVTPDGMYYFGQTQNVEKRWRCNGALYKGTALQPYIEQYGWDNIQHIVLFRDKTKEDALWIENFLIETAREDGVCINQRRSGNISKEEGYRQQCYQKIVRKNSNINVNTIKKTERKDLNTNVNTIKKTERKNSNINVNTIKKIVRKNSNREDNGTNEKRKKNNYNRMVVCHCGNSFPPKSVFEIF